LAGGVVMGKPVAPCGNGDEKPPETEKGIPHTVPWEVQGFDLGWRP
jgi:hypothetical protein